MYYWDWEPWNRQYGPVGPLGPVGGIGITGPGAVGKIGSDDNITSEIQRIYGMLERHMAVTDAILTIVRENNIILRTLQSSAEIRNKYPTMSLEESD